MKGIIDSDVLFFDAKSLSYPGDIVSVISPNTKHVIMHHVNPRFVARHGSHPIRNKEMEWWQKLRDGLAQIEDVHIYCAEDLSNHVALFTANVQAMDPEDEGVILDADVGIAVRVGLHCAPLAHESLELLHGAVCVLMSVPLIPMRI